MDTGYYERDPHPSIDYLKNLDERTLVERVGAYVRNVACISLDIDGRGVSHWMNTGLELENEWMQVCLPDGVAARGGPVRLFNRALSIVSSRENVIR